MPRFGGMGGAFGRMGGGGKVPAAVAGVVFSLTWTDGVAENSGGTTITYSARAFGAADANRVIAVYIGARMVTANTISSVTIGGVSASVATGTVQQQGGANGVNSAIYYASVPTGTTGDVVVTYGAAAARTGISIYSVITSTPTPSTGTGQNAASGNPSYALDVPAGGGGLAGVSQSSASGATTWAGSTAEDFEATATGPTEISTAHTTATGSITIAPTFASTAYTSSAAAWSS